MRSFVQDWQEWGCFFLYVSFYCIFFFHCWSPVLKALCYYHIMASPVTRLSDAINLTLPQCSPGLRPIHQTLLFNVSHFSLSLSPSFQRAPRRCWRVLSGKPCKVEGRQRVSTCAVFQNMREGQGHSMNYTVQPRLLHEEKPS